MKRHAFLAGAAALGMSTALALFGRALGMTGHMVAHMGTVAVAAPLIALGVSGTRWDPATRWTWITPLPMMLVELAAVWTWHTPAARALADASWAGAAAEQAVFLAAGLLLWCAALATPTEAVAARLAGVVALLLTSMHMTLLGALIALAPRPLYGTAGLICGGLALPPLADQQLGGAIMLFLGAGAYLAGGLGLLAGILRSPEVRA